MSKLTENYVDPFEQDLVFKASYTTESKDYFEYLLEQDKREIPYRKEAARSGFIAKMILMAVVTILLTLNEPTRIPLVYIVLGSVVLCMVISFYQNGINNKGNAKYIEKLRLTGIKQNKNVKIHMKTEIYKDEIYVNVGAVKYYVRPQDVEEWYETENLLVFTIRQLKSTPCAVLEKVYIPKEILGDKLEETEAALTRMIEIGTKVLSKMGKKVK